MSTNPMKDARLALGLTQAQLADRAGITRLAVIRAEQGVFTRLPQSIIHILADFDNEISINYREFQRQHREFSYGRLSPTFDFQTLDYSSSQVELSPVGNPLAKWAETSNFSSRMSLCIAFCLHPAVVTKFENTIDYQNIPELITDAFLESGYSIDMMAEFQRSYRLYRLYGLSFGMMDVVLDTSKKTTEENYNVYLL